MATHLPQSAQLNNVALVMLTFDDSMRQLSIQDHIQWTGRRCCCCWFSILNPGRCLRPWTRFSIRLAISSIDPPTRRDPAFLFILFYIFLFSFASSQGFVPCSTLSFLDRLSCLRANKFPCLLLLLLLLFFLFLFYFIFLLFAVPCRSNCRASRALRRSFTHGHSAAESIVSTF